MQMTRGLALSLAFSQVLLAGCEGGGLSGQGGNTLPPEAVVAELDAAALAEFCTRGMALQDLVRELNTDPVLVCTSAGLFARFDGDGLVSTCEAARDGCFDGGPEPRRGAEDAAVLDCEPERIMEQGLSSCDITIAEFDTCHVAFGELLTLFMDTVHCAMSPERVLEMYAIQQQGHPSECAPVAERCPLLIDGGATMVSEPETPAEPDQGH